jgi:hypothetical protein
MYARSGAREVETDSFASDPYGEARGTEVRSGRSFDKKRKEKNASEKRNENTRQRERKTVMDGRNAVFVRL